MYDFGDNWKDLVDKGYLYIPRFLSADELAILVADFRSRPASANANYAEHPIPDDTLKRLDRGKFFFIIESVRQKAGIVTDLFIRSYYFPAEVAERFGWHTDFETSFVFQESFHHLNFFMPIIKPERGKSNLRVVPFDSLQALDPDLLGRVTGGGGLQFFQVKERRPGPSGVPLATKYAPPPGAKTIVYPYVDDGPHSFTAVDVESIAQTPELSAGDLLLLRGDIIHSTQDSDTLRVAASVRTGPSLGKLRRHRLLEGPEARLRFMAKNSPEYRTAFDCLDSAGAEEVTLAQLVRFREQRRESPPPERVPWPSFVKRLLSERAGRPDFPPPVK